MRIPKKIDLAFIPTPVERLKFERKNFLIKRDDLTGTELTGNKVRKLEYLMYDAKKEKAEYIFTTGGEQSNHARATAVVAARLGFKSRLFMWGKNSSDADGNLFIDKFIGVETVFLSKKEFDNVNEVMFEERKKLLRKNKNAYVIPEGGSTTLGIWGYVSFVEELAGQLDLKKLDGIVAASGSGGTAAGLLVGAALKKLKTKIYAVNVLYSKEEITKKILQLAEGCILDYKMPCKINPENLVVIDGYSTEGYKNIKSERLKLIKNFARSTGIILDPAYTGKAFNAYYDHFLKKSKGNKVLFIHTGGIFGVFGKRKKYLEIL